MNGFILSYHWSPDSTRLAYYADQDTDQVFELYTVWPDGTSNIKVNGPLLADGDIVSDYKWTPDSSRLAYKYNTTGNVIDLYTAAPDGTGNTKVNGSLVTDGDVSTFSW